MKLIYLKAIAITLTALVVYFVWASISPFPKASELIGKTHRQIELQLGMPNGSIPDKFIEWEKNRGIFIWAFETDSPIPLDLDSKVCSTNVIMFLRTPLGNYKVREDYSDLNDLSQCRH